MNRESRILQERLETIDAAIQTAKQDMLDSAEQRDSLSEKIDQVYAQINQLQLKNSELAGQTAAIQTQMEQNHERLTSLTVEQAKINEFIATLEQEKEQRSAKESTVEGQTQQLNEDIKKYAQAILALEANLSEADQVYLSSRDDFNLAQTSKVHQVEQREKINSTIEKFSVQLNKQTEQVQLYRERQALLEKRIVECRAELQTSLHDTAKIGKTRTEVEDKFHQMGEEIKKQSQGLNELSSKIDDQQALTASSRADLSRLHGDLEHAQASLEEVILPEGSELPDEITALTSEDIDQKIEKNQRRLDRIGPVNLVAESEYKEQTERSQTLTQQVKDLEDSMAVLRSTMTKMDEEITQKYLATFEAVNANLRSMFTRMFSGGDAYLKLGCRGRSGRGRGVLGSTAWQKDRSNPTAVWGRAHPVFYRADVCLLSPQPRAILFARRS